MSETHSSDTRFWLGFHRVQGIGAAHMTQVMQTFGSAEAAWKATDDDLRAAGLTDALLRNLHQTRDRLDLDAELDKVAAAGAHALTMADTAYPLGLRQISDAPLLLYVRGQLRADDLFSLAIVGTRRATRYGRDVAERMASALAKQGVTIISGLAAGVDASAHAGALRAEGRTLAVLGNGIDRIYPQANSEMAEYIVRHGALISEFPPGTPPIGANFPRRNRLLSGLALGVLVVEAPERSGALITAEAALEHGKDVFAVPNNIFNPMGTGANRLLQEGAKLVMRSEDVLDDLRLILERQQAQLRFHMPQARPVRQAAASNGEATTSVSEATPTAAGGPTPNVALQGIEADVFAVLEHDPLHIDDITRLSGKVAHDVAATLTLLELKGLALDCGAMQYCRSH